MRWTERPENIERVRAAIDKRKRLEEMARFKARNIYDKIRERVVGHDIIAARIAKLIENRALRENREKPLFSLLISGPSGTGKTALAKAIAGAVYSDADKATCRIDCGTLGTGQDSMARVFGSDRVFRGSHKGQIPEFVEQHARRGGLILLDEIEKAVSSHDAPLAKALLGPLDEGRFVSAHDNKVYSAANFIIVATSNADKDALSGITARYLPEDIADPFEELPDLREMDEAIRTALKNTFADEFLNRFDFVSSVAALKPEHQAGIIDRMLEAQARSYGVEIVAYDDASFAEFLAAGTDQFGGEQVRGVDRWIEQKSMDAFAEAKRAGLTRVRVAWREERLILEEADG